MMRSFTTFAAGSHIFRNTFIWVLPCVQDAAALTLGQLQLGTGYTICIFHLFYW